jgi:hypothetical protein
MHHIGNVYLVLGGLCFCDEVFYEVESFLNLFGLRLMLCELYQIAVGQEFRERILVSLREAV